MKWSPLFLAILTFFVGWPIILWVQCLVGYYVAGGNVHSPICLIGLRTSPFLSLGLAVISLSEAQSVPGKEKGGLHSLSIWPL